MKLEKMQHEIDEQLNKIRKTINPKIDRAEIEKIIKDIQLQIIDIHIGISKCAEKFETATRLQKIEKQVRNSQ